MRFQIRVFSSFKRLKITVANKKNTSLFGKVSLGFEQRNITVETETRGSRLQILWTLGLGKAFFILSK